MVIMANPCDKTFVKKKKKNFNREKDQMVHPNKPTIHVMLFCSLYNMLLSLYSPQALTG